MATENTPITIENWKEFNEWCDAEIKKKKEKWVKEYEDLYKEVERSNWFTYPERRVKEAIQAYEAILTQPRTVEAMLTWLANGKE